MKLKKVKQAIAAIIGSLVVISSFSIFVSANSSNYGYELDLTCSSTKYFDDEDTTTYFYVETDYEGESITLVNADDLTEYTMLDDGKFSISGDDMPYDAVYSLRLELNTDGVTYENPKVLSFYAITEDGVKSETITIKIVKRITTLQISEMAAVDEMINALIASESYTSSSFEEKTSMVYELLVSLSEHGTEEYPYSLILPDSINFTGTVYSFKYSCGALGGVSITDPFQTETITTTTTNITTESTTTTTTTFTDTATEVTDSTDVSTTATTTPTTSTDTTSQTTNTTDIAETTTSTTNYKNITKDDFIAWAKNDYQEKTGILPANASLSENANGTYEITLTNENGNVLDVYTVDPVTATGTNQSGEEVNLPQTGVTSMKNWLLFFGGVLMLGFGLFMVKKSRFVEMKK